MSSIVKVVGKRCLEKSFIVLWSVFLFYASFSQWLAETDFWKSPRVYIHKNYTFYQPWYAQQVSRFILLWSSAAGVKFSFGQWGGDHWLKLIGGWVFVSGKCPMCYVTSYYIVKDYLRHFASILQWDHYGPEFRTWSGSGPKCQKWSGIGPELGNRSGFFWDALVWTKRQVSMW